MAIEYGVGRAVDRCSATTCRLVGPNPAHLPNCHHSDVEGGMSTEIDGAVVGASIAADAQITRESPDMVLGIIEIMAGNRAIEFD